MRIIAGRWKSRRIQWPTTGRTRPITDRIKQSLFDMLTTALGTPGELPPVHVADVFAGGGSLGLEALSRGARSVCFFERDREALSVLGKNLIALEANPCAVVVAGDVWRKLLQPDLHRNAFDLVFFDPPFEVCHSATGLNRVYDTLRRLVDGGIVSSKALLVFRHEKRAAIDFDSLACWRIDLARRIGENTITILRVTTELTVTENHDRAGSRHESDPRTARPRP